MKKYLLIKYDKTRYMIDRYSILYAIECTDGDFSYTEVVWNSRIRKTNFPIPFEKFIQALEYFDSSIDESAIIRFNAD